MTGRARLPNRRLAESFELEVGGLRYKVTIGRFPDGSLAECFVSNHKAGNASDVSARDSGILVSLLLQHNCPVRARCPEIPTARQAASYARCSIRSPRARSAGDERSRGHCR
jgi:hypothetical protein